MSLLHRGEWCIKRAQRERDPGCRVTVITVPCQRGAAHRTERPRQAIYEPDWRSGSAIPTRFTTANDETLGMAGLWALWRNPATLEWELSFTMLTINADTHPLFKEMHRPDLKRPPEQQDKRMVMILRDAQYEEWLDAPMERSREFLNQFPAERLVMTPEPLPPKAAKPKPERAKPKQLRDQPTLF